jgi:predicted nucleic acid binding AN1-type Zn finger protein
MAEFTNVGANCEWKECKDLDFLPIICQFCKHNFCKLHFLPANHACEKLQDVKAENLGKTEVRYNCHVENCSKWELAPVLCPFCQKQVCLTHRYQDSHACEKLGAKQQIMPATKQHVSNIIKENKVGERKPRKNLSLSAQKTAAKVQLMKLKLKSVGQTSLPEAERIYFLVHPPQETGKPGQGCFVSKNWSIGKIIDSLADSTKTVNENNITFARKLRIFRNGDMLGCTLDTTLDSLIESESILNGDTLDLDYES